MEELVRGDEAGPDAYQDAYPNAGQETASSSSDPLAEPLPYTSSDLERALGNACRVAQKTSPLAGGAVEPKQRTRWAWWVATFFGAGFLKPGPGTYGSLAATALWLVAGWGVHHDEIALAKWTAVAVVLATAVGIPAATRAAREGGRKDPGYVVIDEVAGQWLTLLLVPPLWTNALVAVLLFRFFDILKPWPICRFEALPEGLGIMADDLVAGLFALGGTQLILHFLEPLR